MEKWLAFAEGIFAAEPAILFAGGRLVMEALFEAPRVMFTRWF
jgi:hypothetical protein